MAVNNQWWLSVSLVLLLSACGGDKEEETSQKTGDSPDSEESVGALPGFGDDDTLLDDEPLLDEELSGDGLAPTVTGILIDGELYGAGTVRNANVQYVGTATPDHSLEFTLNGDFLGTGMAREDGIWTLDARWMSLKEGGHNLQVTAVDKDGVRIDASDPFEFAYVPEAMAPPVILAIDPDTGLSDEDGITSATEVASYGTATPNLPVHVYRDGELIGITEADEEGHWWLAPEDTPLEDGLYHLSADTVYDDIRSAISVLFPLQIDTWAAVPTLALLNATGEENHTADPGLVLGGESEPGSIVSLYQDDSLVDTAVTDDTGSWELDLSHSPRPDGEYSFSVSAVDLAGNESGLSLSHEVRVDTEPPLAPVITGISEDGGLINSDGLTGAQNLYFHGTAEPQSRVAVILNGTELGETVTDSNGDWLYDNSSLSLAEGSHELTATATDKAGNTSPLSDPFAIVVDLTAPPIPTDLAISPETGPQGSGLTSASQLFFSGRAEALSIVDVFLDGGSLGTVITDSQGDWVLDHSNVSLADGSYTFTARSIDLVGNKSDFASPLTVTVTVDTQPPAPPQALAISPETGAPGSGETNVSELFFSGTAEAGAQVDVWLNNNLLGTVPSDNNGDWVLDHTHVSLADGSYSFTALARDPAGNESVFSDPLTVIVDTQALAAPVITHIAEDTGRSASDGITSDTNLWFHGTAEPESTVKVFQDGTELGSILADVNGDWSFDHSATTLVEGSYQLTATANSTTGNESPVSGAFTLVVDTTAPAAPANLVISPETGPDGSGLTSATELVFSGTAETDALVEVWLDADSLGVVLTDGTGNWSLDHTTTTLADGSYNLTARATDVAGNTSVVSDALTVTVDTQAPAAPNVTGISDDTGRSASDGITSDTNLWFHGTAEAASTVTVSLDSVELGSTLADVNGDWSFDHSATTLEEGSYSLTATATDAAGNESLVSEVFTLVVDTTAPNAPADLAISPETGPDGSGVTSANQLVFSGTAEVDALVEVWLDADSLGEVLTDGTGNWSLDHTATTLTDGSYSLTAKATDVAGNTSGVSDALTVTVDTEAPVAPNVIGITEDTGRSDTDGITSDTTLLFNGTAEADSTVTVFKDSVELGSTSADMNGNWSYDHTASILAEGSYQLTATATDTAGNVSTLSDAFTVVVDTTAPVAPANLAISPETGPDGSGVTSANQLIFSGTAEADALVEVWLDATSLGEVLTDGTGNWSLDHTATTLADGSYSLTAKATDVAGNESVVSDALTVTVDTEAPAAPNVIGITEDTGRSDTDGITHDTTLFFNGTAEADSTVTVFKDSVELGSTPADASGNWSFDHTNTILTEGSYQLSATATDAAGNVSPVSAAFTLVVDTTAPNAPANLAISPETGPEGSGLTSATNLVFSGTAEADALVEVWLDADFLGEVLTNGTGTWSLDHSATMLADGSYSLTAKATDVAGNESIISDALTVTVDTEPPAAPNVTGITEDTGVSATDGITNDTTLFFNGTAEADSTVTVFLDSVELGSTPADLNGNWSYDHTATVLNDGAYGVTAVARDAAGNESVVSDAFAVTVDTVAPGLTGTVPAHNATNVALDSTLTLSLDKTVWPMSGELSLRRVADDSLVETIAMNSGAVTGGGSDTLTVTPSASLVGGTSYYVLVDGVALQDTAGNTFAGITSSTTWQFSTEATALVSTTPAHNATGVASDATLVMQFSESVSAGSGDLRIRRGSDDTIFQTISITSDAAVFSGDTLTVTPPDLLGSARDYYIELDSGAVVNSAGADFAGFSGDTHWRFTVVEGDPVTVLNVTSPVANATYDSGALIPVQVVFSEPVDLSGGTPSLTLALDEGARTVSYVSGSGTDTLVFDYSVVLGDASSALDVTGAGALSLNGATLRSATLVDADLTLPAPGAAGSLSVNKSLVIQAVSLVVSQLGDNGYLLNTALGGSALGSSLAGVGDINGSGFEDFALGAPGAGNGTVYVIYGSAQGLPEDIQIAADGSIDPALGFRILGASAGDRLGEAVGGAGDFNGDGIDDLYVTAPGAAMGGTGRGAVYIVWGQQDATRTDVNLAGWATAVGETNSDGVVIPGTEDGQHLGEGSGLTAVNGQVVASGGDFNGDGVMDLVLGHPGSDLSGTDAGRAWVLFGKRQASRANIDLSSPGENGRIIDPGNQPGAAFGQGLSFIGDFNGNGHDDVALGAPGASAFASQAGQVHVLFGNADNSDFPLSALDGTNGFTLSVNQAGALLGHAVAGGDFNGNGRADLALGAPGISQAWVVYGHDSGSYSDVLVDSLGSADGFAIVSETGTDGLGQALASAGDFNGNGLDDLLLGAWQSNANGTGSGAAWLILGRTGTPGTLDLSVLNASEGIAILGGSAGDGFGQTLAAGDFNGDGFSDLVAGAPGSDSGATGAGQVAVVHGTDYGSTVLAGSTGTLAAENIVGTAGDDLLSGGGGADAISSGAGSDLIGIGDLSFRKIRGGRGSVLAAMDALLLETSGTTLDLLGLAPEAIHNVELIDLGDAGNSLNLDRLRLLRLSRTTPQLVVSGGGSDTVTVAAGDLWFGSGSEAIGSDTYNRYHSKGAELLVQSLLGQDGIITFTTSQKYHVDTTGVIAGNVEDFPLLLRITDSTIIQAVEPGAPDIRLLDADGKTLLDYEILRWDQTNNLAELWVKVPRIYGETDGAVSTDCEAAGVSSGQCNTVTLLYDNATVTDGQSPATLWEGYAGVWHLNETSATANALDATGFGNDATLVNGDGSSVDAIIGKGRKFSSAGAMQVPFHEASMSVAENKAFTFSAWIHEHEITDDCLISLNRRNSRPMAHWGTELNNWRLMSSERSINCLTTNRSAQFLLGDGTELSGGTFEDPAWVFLTVTHDGTRTRYYRNNGVDETATGTLVMEEGLPLVFGAQDMMYDSVRLARFAMSAEEVQLMHANQIPGSTLVSPAP